MSICWRDTKGTASARRGRAPPCTLWIFPELANSRRSRRIVSSETLYRLLSSAARTRPSLPSSSRMYWWRSSFRTIGPASASGFIFVNSARIRFVMHVYACIIRCMHGTAKRSGIQDLSEKRSVRAVVFDYGNVLCLEAQRISQTGSWKHDVLSGTVTVSPEVFRIFGVKPDENTSTAELWLSRNH